MADQEGIVAERDYGIAPPAYRLPPEARAGSVRLQVADLDRSLEYYGRVLGLAVLNRSEGRASLGPAGAAGAAGALVELHEREGAAPVPRRGRLGLFHYAILVPDRASLGRLYRHLAELGARAGASDHLVSEALYVQDPDGLGIEVYADRPRSTWRHRDRQLLMATEPLDTGSLLASAGDAPWTGMPAGTVIGHVHLHVGDIPAADAFYHRALGLDRTVWNYPGALFFSAGGYHHHLGVNTWAAGAAPAGESDARLLEWEIVVPSAGDVRRAVESLTAAGHAVETTADGGVVRDPWGTALRIRPD